MGWRFVNPALDKAYGTESMPQTGDNVAADHGVDRADQDAFALRSQQRAAAAQASGFFAEEIIPVTAPGARRGQTGVVRSEEHTSELQSLMRISYAVFCLKKKKKKIK